VEQDSISKGSVSQEFLPKLEKAIHWRANLIVSDLNSLIFKQMFCAANFLFNMFRENVTLRLDLWLFYLLNKTE